MNVISTVKEHPYITAGGVFVVGAILILMFSGGKTASPETAVITTASPVSDNSAVVAANTAAGVQQAGIMASLQASLAATNAALEASKDQTAVSLANINASADTTKFVSTLDADVENRKTQASLSIAQTNATAATQITALNAAAATQLSSDAKDVAFNTNAAQVTVGLANITASQAVAMAQIASDNQLGNAAQQTQRELQVQQNEIQNAAQLTQREAQLQQFMQPIELARLGVAPQGFPSYTPTPLYSQQ